MGIPVILKSNSYKYNGKCYSYGEGLCNLANSDLQSLLSAITNTDFNSKKNNSDYINIFLKYKSPSLHLNMLKDLFHDFLELDYEISEEESFLERKIYDENELRHNLQWFILPLLNCQNKIKNLFNELTSGDSKTLQIAPKIIKLLKSLPNADYFDYSADFNQNSSFYKFVEKPNKLILKKNNTIEISTSFYDIQSFVIFELQKAIENNVKLIKCPNCKKFYIVNDERSIFCSPSCKNKYNNAKASTNIFYLEYRKKYKHLHYKYQSGKTEYKRSYKEIDLAKALYSEYKNKPIELFDEFKAKLDQIK